MHWCIQIRINQFFFSVMIFFTTLANILYNWLPLKVLLTFPNKIRTNNSFTISMNFIFLMQCLLLNAVIHHEGYFISSLNILKLIQSLFLFLLVLHHWWLNFCFTHLKLYKQSFIQISKNGFLSRVWLSFEV